MIGLMIIAIGLLGFWGTWVWAGKQRPPSSSTFGIALLGFFISTAISSIGLAVALIEKYVL